MQLPLVMARAIVPTFLAPFILAGIAQPLSFRIEKGIQRLFHGPTNNTVQVTLDSLIIDLDDIAQNSIIIFHHGGSYSRLSDQVVADCHSSPSQGRLPKLNLRNTPYVICQGLTFSVVSGAGGR